MKQCLVCQKKYWARAIKVHIINAAKAEVFKHTMLYFDYMRNKPCTRNNNCGRSSSVMLRQLPHMAYYRRNLKLVKKFV